MHIVYWYEESVVCLIILQAIAYISHIDSNISRHRKLYNPNTFHIFKFTKNTLLIAQLEQS